MDKLKLERPWDEVKETLKESKVELTDEDLEYNESNTEELLEHLSKKLSLGKEEVRDWIESASANKAKAG